MLRSLRRALIESGDSGGSSTTRRESRATSARVTFGATEVPAAGSERRSRTASDVQSPAPTSRSPASGEWQPPAATSSVPEFERSAPFGLVSPLQRLLITAGAVCLHGPTSALCVRLFLNCDEGAEMSSSQLTARPRSRENADDYPKDGTYESQPRGCGTGAIRRTAPTRQARMGKSQRPTASLSEARHAAGKESVGAALHRISHRHLGHEMARGRPERTAARIHGQPPKRRGCQSPTHSEAAASRSASAASGSRSAAAQRRQGIQHRPRSAFRRFRRTSTRTPP